METVNIEFTGNQDGYQQYEAKDLNLLNTVTISNPFGTDQDYIEYFIYDLNGNLLASNYFVESYTPDNPDPETGTYTSIQVDPEGDVKAEGYTRGTVNITYNFFRKLFNSDITKTFWIKEISGDRTELRVCRQDLSNIDLEQAFIDYTDLVSLKAYYPDFYLNFANDNIIIGVNVLYALQDDEGSLLIKLYEPLPDDIELKDNFWIVDKLSNSANYTVNIEVPAEVQVETDTLRGPNYNVDIIERIGQTTPLYNYTNIFQTSLSASYQQLKSLMEEKSLDINVDYSDFSNFVHFSSATERIYNFAYKVQQIENYNNDIAALQSVSANANIVSSSKEILQNNINNIIEKFDGYEYYLYYTTASTAWPKSGSYQPFTLYSVTSSQALNWLGSPEIEPTSTSYSILYSASLYDINNPNALNNTIPAYLKEDGDNQPYQTFLSMVGQHFDNIWIYLKDVTERYDADNNLDRGISKDLVADALRSLGIKLYTNTSISDNIYYSLLAINPDGSLTPPTGSERVEYYIPFSAGNIYVNGGFTVSNYVLTTLGGTATIPGDDVTKEFYKRLYHNVPYLLKTRGTMRGLRALINCFGIPDTILRINEFGGSDKLEATADLIQRRHSLAYLNTGSVNLSLPWVGQNYYYVSGGLKYVLPDAIEFRFKSTGIPDSNHISQSIFQVGQGSAMQFGVNLIYDSSSAVPSSSYENYGNLRLMLSGSFGYAKTSPIYLPFYDSNLWWNLMIKREVGGPGALPNTTNNRYWVYAKSTAYDEEGNPTIAFQGSQSIYVDGTLSSSYNASWNKYNTSSYAGMFAAYLGGTGSNNVLSPASGQFQGYFQEFRYWATPLSESAFNQHVINSTSYRGNTVTGSLFGLTFRLPLGSNLNVPYNDATGAILNPKDYDLYELGITYIEDDVALQSYHPALTGGFVSPFNGQIISGIESFISGSTAFSYGLFGGPNNKLFQPFEITDLIPTPSTGVNQKVNNKVSVVAENDLVENLLSPDISIQKYNPSISKNSTDIEVGFSPSDVLDLDMSNQLGYFNIDEYIGNPSDAYSSSYQSLDKLRNTYFEKYTSRYNVEDFIRLIKYYDNSLFKMIKDFVPARANLSTGIIVKPHILERPKYTRNEPIVTNEAYWSGSIDMVSISGSNPEDMYLNTAYTQSITTPLGTVVTVQTDLSQPFTGDFGGNTIIGASDYFSQTEVSSITAPWTSSIATGNRMYTTYSIDPLENNATNNIKSTYRLAVDYSFDPDTPVNLGLITGALALYPVRAASPGSTVLSSNTWPFAEVNDYNWSVYSRINPRYQGSRIYSLYYNTYTSASQDYSGDQSYGKTATIDKIKKKFAYLRKFSIPTLVLPNRGNAEIKYLIDQNQDVTDLSKTNPNIFDVQNIFKSGETIDISLFNYDTTDPAIQRLANNTTLQIYQGGFRYYPILHNISGSHEQVFNFFPPLEVTVTTTTTSGGTANVPAGVLNPASWSVTWYADSPAANQHEFNITFNGPGGGGAGNMPAGEYTASVSINFASSTGLVPLAAWLNAGTMPGGNISIGRGGAVSIVGRFPGAGSSTTNFGGAYVNTIIPPPYYYVGGTFPVPSTKFSLSAFATGSGGTTYTTSTTYYTTTVTSSASQSCFYYLTGSNSIAFAGAVAEYYNNNLIYSSSSDPYWSASIMEPVAIPFTLDVGDEVHIYNPQVGWYESEEYFITGKYITGSGTGSRLIIGLDRPINEESLRPVFTDPIYGWATGSCRYIIVKKIPDETNLVIRYDPKADITQEGTLYPQYIDPVLRKTAGDIIQSLKSDNLI